MSYEPELQIKKMASYPISFQVPGKGAFEFVGITLVMTDESVRVWHPIEREWREMPAVPGTRRARELEAHQGLPEDDETEP